MIFPRKKLILPCHKNGYLQSASDARKYRDRFKRNPLAKVADMFVPKPLRMSPGYPCCCGCNPCNDPECTCDDPLLVSNNIGPWSVDFGTPGFQTAIPANCNYSTDCSRVSGVYILDTFTVGLGWHYGYSFFTTCNGDSFDLYIALNLQYNAGNQYCLRGVLTISLHNTTKNKYCSTGSTPLDQNPFSACGNSYPDYYSLDSLGITCELAS